jgi:hypothetical protein
MQQDMRTALKQKKDFIMRELDLIGEDTPVSDFERSNLLVQIVSKVRLASKKFSSHLCSRKLFPKISYLSSTQVWSNYPQSKPRRLSR